jgi:polar amino acid transport system substrate-binding protein
MTMRLPTILASAAVLLACADLSAQAGAPVRFCLASDNLPMSAHYPPAMGIEVDLARAISERLGREALFVWRNAHEESPEEALRDGRCDVAAGAIVDPGLMAEGLRVPGLALTDPYYSAGYLLIHRPEVPSAGGLAELRDVRIGVEMVSIPIYTLKLRGHKVYALDDHDDVIKAVADGRIDYGYVWGPLVAWLLRNRNDVVLAEAFEPVDHWNFALAVREEDEPLRQALNGVVRGLTAGGAVAEIFAKYGVPYLPPCPLPEAGSSCGRAGTAGRAGEGGS